MLLVFVVVASLVGSLSSAANFNQTLCEGFDEDIGRFLAEIDLSDEVSNLQVIGGEVVYTSDDGLYLEVEGDADDSVCITLVGEFDDEEPEVEMLVSPVNEVPTRNVRSARTKRATQIWKVSSVPNTSDRKKLLKAFEPYHRQWGDESLSGSTKRSSSAALSVAYAKGSYSKTKYKRGAGFYSTPSKVPDKVTKLILQYDVYFENFGFGKGGKLPGLFGGEKGDGAYKCSGGSNPSSCFSLRLMWRANGDGELYAYIPVKSQQKGFEDRSDVIYHTSYGQSMGRGKIQFKSGTWNTVTEQVTLNTPGKTNGSVKICNKVRGSQKCYTAKNISMRDKSTHYLRGLFFSTFFGGGSSSWGAPNECRTYFRNFKLSKP